MQIAFFVQKSDIPGVAPAAGEEFCGCIGIAVVALDCQRCTQANLSRLAARCFLAVVVGEAHQHTPDRFAHRVTMGIPVLGVDGGDLAAIGGGVSFKDTWT